MQQGWLAGQTDTLPGVGWRIAVRTILPLRVANPGRPGDWMEERDETLPPRYHRNSALILDCDPSDPKPYDAELTSP